MSEFQTRDFIGYVLRQLPRGTWYTLSTAYLITVLTLLGYVLSHLS